MTAGLQTSGKAHDGGHRVARVVHSVWCVRFDDSGQRLADTHVHLPVRAQRIIDELLQCGYPLTDRKTGQPLIRLTKR